MHQITIGGGVHGHGFDAHFLAGAQDAQGDFATICNNDFIQHR
jgi:hypothetical protein